MGPISMGKGLLIHFWALVITITATSQNNSISGRVVSNDSLQTPVMGAVLRLDQTNLGAVTNGNGYYIIHDIPEANYDLIISCLGYNTERYPVQIRANETSELKATLTETITSLDQLIIVARGTTGLKDIPGSVHYITPVELQKFSYSDINRTLRAVPGVNLQEEDGFGLRPNIGLRGTGVERSSKITIMEDGILIAPAPYADPAAYYFPTIGRMQGVEILKGSSQIQYGPFTTGGAINLISTQIPSAFSGRVNLLGGSFGSRNLHAFVGNSHKNFGYLVETFQYGADGFKHIDYGGNSGFDKQDYLAKFKFNLNPDARIFQSITFRLGETRELSNETYLGLTSEDFYLDPFRRYAASQKDQMNTEQSIISASHLIRFSQVFKITTTAYRTQFKRNWYKLDKVVDSLGTKTSISHLLDHPEDFDEAFAILNGATSNHTNALLVKANNRSYNASGIQSNLYFHFKTGKGLHDLNIGIRYHQDGVDRFQWEDEYGMDSGNMELSKSGIPGTESNLVKNANAVSAFAQYKYKYRELTITPGVRYENIKLEELDYGKNDVSRVGTNLQENKNQVDIIIPGIGFDYQFNRYLAVFAGVHKGSSPPGTHDETLPEESINYEIGSRYSKNSTSAQIVIFHNDYSNLLGSDLAASGGSGTGDLFNAGAVRTDGVEFQFSFDFLAKRKKSQFSVPFTLAYTYTDASFKTSFVSTFEDWTAVERGDELPYLAGNQITFTIGLEHKKFSINLSGRYMDEMRTRPGQGDIPENEKTDAYFVMDLSLSYRLQHNVSLFSTVTNMTDEVYVVARRPAGLRPGMPRAFMAGLKVTL